MLTKIKHRIAVQLHCKLHIATAILMLSVVWWKLVLTKIKHRISGATPLYVAACNGHLDVVRHLVEVVAGKDHAENRGNTQSALNISSRLHSVLLLGAFTFGLESDESVIICHGLLTNPPKILLV